MVNRCRRHFAAALCCVVSFSLSSASLALPSSEPPSLSPEAVAQLGRDGQPYLLVQANSTTPVSSGLAADRYFISYVGGPSSEAAQKAVAALRKKGSKQVFWLSGTPEDWRQAGLHFPSDPMPLGLVTMTPAELASALKSENDVQVIDLRAKEATGREAFPNVLSYLPHELQALSTELSRRQWLVLIDAGDRVAVPMAEGLLAKGYRQVVVLEGGYPAWAAYQRKSR